MASPKKTTIFFSHLADRQRRDTQPFEDIVMMVKLQGEQHGILRLEILDAGADRVRHLVIAETRPHSERVGPGDEDTRVIEDVHVHPGDRPSIIVIARFVHQREREDSSP
eukprot:COSAG06_NODE_13325_length_1268_cov_1.544055_3_plen_109_part_01